MWAPAVVAMHDEADDDADDGVDEDDDLRM